MDRTISYIDNGIAKNDRIITKWYLSVVDIALTITPPLSFARYPIIILETKFDKTATLLIKSLGTAIYIYPFLWNKDITITQ